MSSQHFHSRAALCDASGSKVEGVTSLKVDRFGLAVSSGTFRLSQSSAASDTFVQPWNIGLCKLEGAPVTHVSVKTVPTCFT